MKMTPAELADLAKREAVEARLTAKFGPDCFAFANLMDDLERKGNADIVLSPFANYD